MDGSLRLSSVGAGGGSVNLPGDSGGLACQVQGREGDELWLGWAGWTSECRAVDWCQI